MEKIINIPENVTIEIENLKITIKGEKGELKRDFYNTLFRGLKIEKIDNKIKISSDSDKRKLKAMVGTITAHINNMLRGVIEGFEYKLKIVYLHFPMKIEISEKEIIINNFLGERSPRRAKIVGDCKVEIKGDEIFVKGINKEDAGQTALNLEIATKVPARDRRVFQDGIFLVK